MSRKLSPRLEAAALQAMPLLKHYENQLASSLSSDPNSHKGDREPRAWLNELMEALNEDMGLTKGDGKPWEYAKLKEMEAAWIEAKIRSRCPIWSAPPLRPQDSGHSVQWRALWQNMLLEVMKANKAIHRQQKQIKRQALLIRQLKADPGTLAKS